MSSGQRTLFGEVAAWVLFAGISVATVTHLDELTAIGHRLMGTDFAKFSGRPSATVPGSAAADAGGHAGGGYTVELPVGTDGHYHAEAEINGRSVPVLVDTGASLVALTAEDAEAAGIYVNDKDFTHQMQTANGMARVAPVTLERIAIGDITIRNVRGIVSEAGAMSVSLLGMTFLGQLDRVDIRSGKLILQD
jgi:aspartyl protease family protein